MTVTTRSRVALTSLCLAVSVVTVVGAGRAAASPNHGPGVVVTVDAAVPGRVIPTDFVGLSFEANQLHRTWTDPQRGNVAALLGNLGVGNLRFSANQVDQTAWMPRPDEPTPSWAVNRQRIEPDDLSRVGRLAANTGWSVDLGVNLGHFDPAAAADQSAAAKARIGAGLRSIQIGNEPNLFVLNAPTGTRRAYNPQSYVRDVLVYRKAIRAAASGVPIEGPDTAGAGLGVPPLDAAAWPGLVQPWLTAYTAAFGDRSRTLNQHYYPYVNVTRVGVPGAAADALGALPTVERLLDPDTRAKQRTFLRQFSATASRAGLKPLLSEANSVAKEGRDGVTDTFGAALWTVDFLMAAAREGIVGVNLHNQVDDCRSYPLFCFPDSAARRADTARVNPNYYAALMVSQMVGGALLSTSVSGGAHVTAYAVRMPTGEIKVIVDDFDRAFRGSVTVRLKGARAGAASVQRLTGPSIHAVRGTRFAEATVTPAGRFTARPGTAIVGTAGDYRIGLSRPGAALLTAR
ncbi:hypothetical protein [Gordonia aichiensis]|uniref:hypothetical protein n=1 Tax=Gordonia aichiensis TaxID=36820 RepID=UPI0032657C51